MKWKNDNMLKTNKIVMLKYIYSDIQLIYIFAYFDNVC